MFNFLVIQPGSSVSFLCAHVRITAAKRQVHLVPIALRESFSPGLPSPPSVMGRDMKAISQTPAAKAEFPLLRTSRGNSRDARSSGMRVVTGCVSIQVSSRAVLGEERREARGGTSSISLLGISPGGTTQGRDPGVFRPVQKVSFTGGCFALKHRVVAGMESSGVSS